MQDRAHSCQLGDTTVTIFKQLDESSAVSTVVIRGATENTLDNFEKARTPPRTAPDLTLLPQAVDDGVNTFKTLTKDPRVVAGAGATEIEIATQLAAFAASREGLEQYSIRAFAEAFEVVPFALAENTGLKVGAVACGRRDSTAAGRRAGVAAVRGAPAGAEGRRCGH